MSTTTSNLGLFKYDTSTDAKAAFSITRALNDNWDILDNTFANIDALPSQSGNSGKFLTTNGTTASWSTVSADLPSQSGNSGKVLTTNGSTASWGAVTTIYPLTTVYTVTGKFYRKYSDDWCVQGGRFTRTATGKLQITLPVTFASTSYYVYITNEASESYSTASTFYTPYILTKTTSSFYASTNAAIASIAYWNWIAVGKI